MSLLQVDDVTVDFGGLRALSNVDLDVAAGRITGLIGPNGAGKTTLFNVISGLQEPTGGTVAFDGAEVTTLGPHERARLGIARTFQRLEIFGSLTVRENVLVAAEIRRRWAREKTDVHALSDDILGTVGIAHLASHRADALSTGLARLCELARALATAPRMLLLDEPSSGLDEGETDQFARLLERFASEGLAILIVEHDVELVMRLCSRIHVLDFGRKIAVGTATEVRDDPAVQAAYLGAAGGTDNAA